eukprot:6724806-Prymnesium_polylepis.2
MRALSTDTHTLHHDIRKRQQHGSRASGNKKQRKSTQLSHAKSEDQRSSEVLLAEVILVGSYPGLTSHNRLNEDPKPNSSACKHGFLSWRRKYCRVSVGLTPSASPPPGDSEQAHPSVRPHVRASN